MKPLAGVVVIAAALLLARSEGEAHKPITSPFTFNEDVFPILQERCGACHRPGGVAPMSLLTHPDAVPWGESMRAELMAGHMPPTGLASSPQRFRSLPSLSGRELNVLLTWASGGTPAGDPERTPMPPDGEAPSWPLGDPDAVLPLPEVTLPAGVQDRIETFTIQAGAAAGRPLRAIDLRPGTPAIVRNAVIRAEGPAPAPPQVLALWLPGDHPVASDEGASFRLRPGANLVVRLRYRKTWEYEQRAMSDRSEIGLYFAADASAPVRTIEVSGNRTVIGEPLRALAIHPDPDTPDADVTVVASRPDGSRDELVALRIRAGWTRRYWFREPVLLPKGTRIEVQAKAPDERLRPPGALPPTTATDRREVRLGLDVVPAD